MGLTQQEIADILGVSRQCVSAAERNALRKLRKLILAGEAPYLRELLGDDVFHDLRPRR